MKPIQFHPEAESEMIEAANWYEEQQSKLGKSFLTTIQDAINRITVNPELYPIIELDVRRCLVKTFPLWQVSIPGRAFGDHARVKQAQMQSG